MKKHEISLKDLSKAMNTEILIAACANKDVVKRLTFNPASLNYKIEYKTDSDGKHYYSSDPLKAIGIYNEH